MQYAIELYCDMEAEEKLYAKLSTKFMKWKTRPHPTLACFNDVDEEKCIIRLKKFAKNHIQMPTYIASVGMLTDTKTIFASPVMNNAMY